MSKEVELLLKYLQNGIKKHSIRQVNEVLSQLSDSDALNNKSIADKVINIVSFDFGISKKVLLEGSGRKTLTDARHIAYFILYNNGFTMRDIAKVFNSWQSVIHKGIKRMQNLDTRIHPEQELKKRYENIKTKV